MEDAAATPVLGYDGGTAEEPQSVVLGYVVIKVVGVVFVAWSLALATTVLAYFTFSGIRSFWIEPSLAVRILLPPALYAGIGVVLLVYARPLARRLFRMSGTLMPMPPAITLVAIVTVAVGLQMAASSLADLIRLSVTLVYSLRQNGASFPPTERGTDWVGALARFGVGVWLFLRPGWVVGQWRTRAHMP